jgi:hypothetical protein
VVCRAYALWSDNSSYDQPYLGSFDGAKAGAMWFV